MLKAEKKAEKFVRDEEILFPNDEEEKDFYEQRRWAARAGVVQDYKKQVTKFLTHLNENYRAELRVKRWCVSDNFARE
jgi:hypothetical protein